MKNGKYEYSGIGIELTRQCNKSCVHCSCGEAQDVTISRDVVDKIFSSVKDCRDIVFYGGEPLLHTDLVEYVIDQILASRWTTTYLEVTTNGSVLDPRIVSAFARFCEIGKNRVALLRISRDQFHDAKESEAAMSYYTDLCKPYPSIRVQYVESHITGLIKCGRVNTLLQKRPETWAKYMVEAPSRHNHRACIIKGVVQCQLLISANGNVGFADQNDYDSRDRMRFGNILDSSLDDLVDKNNAQCFLTCDEAEHIRITENADNRFRSRPHQDLDVNSELFKLRPALHLMSRVSDKINTTMLDLRQKAHELYPNIPLQEIIKALPIPAGEDIPFMVQVMTQTGFVEDDVQKYVDAETLREFEQYSAQTTNESQKTIVYDSLRVLARIIKDAQSDSDLTENEQFQRLAILDGRYKSGMLSSANSEVFPCDYTRAEAERQEAKRLAEEAKQVRCPFCKKVIQYAGRNIHCMERSDRLICEYCGRSMRAA